MNEENNYRNSADGNENFQGAGSPVFETPGVGTAATNYVTFIPYGYTPKTYEEKRKIKKSALMIGLSLLILMGITFFWATVYFLVMRFLGFDMEKAQNVISDPAIMQLLQIVLSVLMFTVPFLLVYKVNRQQISELIPLGKPQGNKTAMFFLGLSCCAFANIANSYCANLFQSIGIDYNVDYGDNPEGFFGFLLSFLATAVVPGLMEEFACRGLILGLLRKYGDGFAILVSAILFGLLHGNFDQMPFAFMVGLALGYIVVQTNSLWIAIAVHAANNFVSVAFTYLLSGLSQDVQNLIYSLYLMAALAIGVFAAAFFGGAETFRLKKSDTECTVKQKFKWFFSSAPVIIFIILCFLESLLYF